MYAEIGLVKLSGNRTENPLPTKK